MQKKQFISPADVARELDISTATVLRMIHAGSLPAIRVSARIYRVPSASFEMYKTGMLRVAAAAPLRRVKRQPRLGDGEVLPQPRHASAATAR